MKIKILLNWKNYDKNGQLINEIEHEANSLVIAFLQVLMCQMTNQSISSVNDTGNTSRIVNLFSANLDCSAVSGDDTLGVVVGTNNTAVTVSDYDLNTKIADGTSAGELSYGTVALDSAETIAGSTVYFNISRTFTNNSGGSITVEEVGLIGTGASTRWKFLFDRSLSSNAIADSNSATVTYKISVSV